jgi:hypothetical protein
LILFMRVDLCGFWCPLQLCHLTNSALTP